MPLIVLLVLFVTEVAALIAVGSAIGVPYTVLLFVGTSVLGGVLLRKQGRRTVTALRDAQAHHRNPGRELADGALGGIGALLLVLPGFVTDVLGLLLVLPPTRAVVRPLVVGAVARQVLVVPSFGRRAPGGPEVIDGEVLSTDDPDGAGWGRTPLGHRTGS